VCGKVPFIVTLHTRALTFQNGRRLVPGKVVGLVGERVVKVAAGGFHTLALSEAGNVFAWGYNAHGQVGDGTRSSTSLPVCVLAGSAGSCCIAIAAGHAHSLALLAQILKRTLDSDFIQYNIL
jgi:alpha-tubulin suppressor-like RCC1 family protein